MGYDFAEIKATPILSFLARIGINPVRNYADYALYHAPYRSDIHPSFKVSKRKNRWYDLATMESGDIIDLGKLIYGTTDIVEVIRRIHSFENVAFQRPSVVKQQPVSNNPYAPFRDVRPQQLTQQPLLSYLATRCIDMEIARKYCVELHYTFGARHYYALGFENVRHGYEARNISFKGCVGPKDISLIRQDKNNVDITVFEGFMDFLSYLTFNKRGDMLGITGSMDFLVLNSVSNLRRAMSWLEHYQTVTCCLDNDDAGRRAVDMLGEVRDGVFDVSDVYKGYKDLNDFLRKKPYCP